MTVIKLNGIPCRGKKKGEAAPGARRAHHRRGEETRERGVIKPLKTGRKA